MTDDERWTYVVCLFVIWSVILAACIAMLPLHVMRMAMLGLVTVGTLHLILGYFYVGLWLVCTAVYAHFGPVLPASLDGF